MRKLASEVCYVYHIVGGCNPSCLLHVGLKRKHDDGGMEMMMAMFEKMEERAWEREERMRKLELEAEERRMKLELEAEEKRNREHQRQDE